jgi:hypothetical protein
MPLKAGAHIDQTLTLRLKGSEIVEGRLTYQLNVDHLLFSEEEAVFNRLKFVGRMFSYAPGGGLNIQIEGLGPGRGLCQGWLTCLSAGPQPVESGWIGIQPIDAKDLQNMTALVHLFSYGPEAVVTDLRIIFTTDRRAGA